MSLQIFTTVYGESHINLFQKSCLRSLSFLNNKRALYEAKACWNIFSEEKYFLHLRKIIDAYLPELEVNLVSMTELNAYIDPIQTALIMLIEKCISTDSKLLMAPPDTIFGDGTVANLLKIGREKGACVVVPHPRVLPPFLDEFSTMMPNVSNPELVTLSWKYLHKAWTDAEVGHEFRNSFVSGVSWQEIGPKLYSVIHWLPTVYLADFLPVDLEFFKNSINFGVFDHVWPSILVEQGRQRFAASSDACFIVELTDADKNVPPVWPGDVESYWQVNEPNHEHNKINRQIVSIFRGE